MAVSEKKLPCHKGGFSPPSCEDGDDSDSEDDHESDSEDEECEEPAGVIFKFKDSLAFQKESLSNLVDRLGRAHKLLTIVQQSDLVKDSQGEFSKDKFSWGRGGDAKFISGPFKLEFKISSGCPASLADE